MPIGSAPPDPYKEPHKYLVWYHELLQTHLSDGDTVGALKLMAEQQDTIDAIRNKLGY